MSRLGFLLLSVFFAAKPANADPFTLAIVGDAQYDWGCDSQANTTSDYCNIAANKKKSLGVQGTETNELVIARVIEIRRLSPNFQGLVINGDLTRFGSQGGSLGKFKENYMGKYKDPDHDLDGFWTWPGLGNHDYENPVNECRGPKVSTFRWNECAADMMQFLAGFLEDTKSDEKTAPRITSYDVTRYAKNPAQLSGQRNVSGSLAYSWDIGDFHFVQLNDYPTYQTNFTRGYVGGVSSWQMQVTPPSAWLTADLATAVALKKKIILNWHRFDKYDPQQGSNPDYALLTAWLKPYAQNIKVIFVAHLHDHIGTYGSLQFPATSSQPAISVPVYYSGSPIWNRFLKADFDSNGSSCTITIGQVNSMLPFTGTTANPVVVPCN